MSVIDTLKHEHKIVLLVLEGAGKELASIEKTGRVNAEKIRTLLDFFRNFTDKCHHSKEEKHLFPKLRERGFPGSCDPVTVMLSEHEEGRGRLRAIAEALPKAAQGDMAGIAAVQENLAGYIHLLRGHIDKEDNVLFEFARQMLTPGDQRALEAAFEKVEAEEMGEGVHEKYHRLAHELADQ